MDIDEDDSEDSSEESDEEPQDKKTKVPVHVLECIVFFFTRPLCWPL
jgi:hypothetical protein